MSVLVSDAPTLIGDVGEDNNVKRSLCDRCKTVGLEVNNFIVNTPTVDADNVWQPQRYESRKADNNFTLRSGTNHHNFATLEDLNQNKGSCSFCQLLHRAINRYSGVNTQKIEGKTTCSLRWEVHGRAVKSKSHFVNSTRRIRLSWDERTGHTQEAFILFVAPRNTSRAISEAVSKYDRKTHFLGRELGDQKECQALIKSWLDICIGDHHKVCSNTHGTEDEFKKLVRETYFGVIDVADMQLKALPFIGKEPDPFVALSYVWGPAKPDEAPYVTNRLNVMMHIQHGGLETAWDKLPRTLQDTIMLVSRLGYRYVWIDSLCIVQDSDQSWQLNARAMHLVYGNALFTICAADGCDSTAGLRAAEAILRIQGSLKPPATGAQAQPSGDDADGQPMSEDIVNGVRLMVTRPLEATIDDSEWNKRAWTFQERVLSRRCLIFAENRVYFQCRTTHFSQDIYTDGSKNAFLLDRANSPLRTLRELQQRPLWFYFTYVRMYTGRRLTKPRDVLAAFEGIAWLLGQYMDAPSLFGMPTSHFDLALLWTPLTKTRLRRARAQAQSGTATSCTQDAMGNCTCNHEQKSFGAAEFPTWSWAGWMDGRIQYDSAMLEGCLTNVREWLTHHTWIQWHIRNEKGHLRPLWDIMTQNAQRGNVPTPVPARENQRWLGYPSVAFTSDETLVFDDVTVTGDKRVPRPSRREAAGEDRRPTSDQGPEPPLRHKLGLASLRYQLHPLSISLQPGIPPPPPRRRTIVSRDDPPDDEANSTISSEISLEHGSNQSYATRNSRRREPENEERRAHILRWPNQLGRESQWPRSSLPSQESSDNDNRDGNGNRYKDKYGRWIKKGSVVEDGLLKFAGILPDNPFGVIRELPRSSRTSGRSDGDRRKTARPRLDCLPILQFYTWCTELHVVIRNVNKYNNNTTETKATSENSEGLTQCDILDKSGDWCGAISLDDEWIRARQQHIFQFAALSDAHSFTRNECPVWNYYIPREQDESAWDVYLCCCYSVMPSAVCGSASDLVKCSRLRLRGTGLGMRLSLDKLSDPLLSLPDLGDPNRAMGAGLIEVWVQAEEFSYENRFDPYPILRQAVLFYSDSHTLALASYKQALRP